MKHSRSRPFRWVRVAQSSRESTFISGSMVSLCSVIPFRSSYVHALSLGWCCKVIPEHQSSHPFHWVYVAQSFQGTRVHNLFTGFMLLRYSRAHTCMPFLLGTCCSVIPEHQSSQPFHWVRVAQTFQSTYVHALFTGYVLLGHTGARTFVPISPGSCSSVIPGNQSSRPFHWVRVSQTFQSTYMHALFTGYVLLSHSRAPKITPSSLAQSFESINVHALLLG